MADRQRGPHQLSQAGQRVAAHPARQRGRRPDLVRLGCPDPQHHQALQAPSRSRKAVGATNSTGRPTPRKGGRVRSTAARTGPERSRRGWRRGKRRADQDKHQARAAPAASADRTVPVFQAEVAKNRAVDGVAGEEVDQASARYVLCAAERDPPPQGAERPTGASSTRTNRGSSAAS